MIFYFENIYLFIFFSIAIIAAFFVIFSVNPVHSLLFLILVFFNISGLLLLLGFEYFALIFLIIYIGALAVLFLFIIMMLNIKIIELKESFWRYIPVGIFLSSLFIFEIFYLINFNIKVVSFNYLDYINYINWISLFNRGFSLEYLGELLYTYFFLAFLLGGIILFLAMIGSIVLTLNQSIFIKRQKIYKQVLRKSSSIILKKVIKQ